MNQFFAMMSRMKYIDRWALMRNARQETISEHSMEVSMLAHALAVIGNKRLGKNYNAEKAALIGLYHDANEIITGDMPTPVKYANDKIKDAYKEVEKVACEKLLFMLPEDMRDSYDSIFFPKEEDVMLWKLVKGADKLSAYIKCIEEENAGNKEFATAKNTIYEQLTKIQLEEVKIFMTEFLPAYGKTLDELSQLD
ncbi:MAG: 5'-deoxynucleotidase [Lachnospiraceae bacterium]|nr:5'-deoxynucleotidase [Lachnospiraceae bacterium]